MGKFTSKILSLVMALAITVMAVPVSVSMAADNSILDENYEFYELVYSPSLDMYVAAAKDYSSSNHSVKFYASADALSWKEVFSGNSRSYANPKTRQQLVWIENPGMFAAIFADGTYTSNDGLNWERNATLSWSSAGNIATNGEQIAVAANDKFRMWENATTAPYEVLDVSDLVNEAGENTYYADNVAISPKDADGNMQYIVLDGAGYDTYSHNVAGTKTDSGYTYAKTGQGIYNYGDGLYNTIYNPVTKNWLTVNGKQNLFVIYNAGKRDAIQIPGVTAISAVALNDAYIVAGTADGKLFYTENTENGLTKSVWTEIPCTYPGGNAEEITAVAFGADGELTILTKRQILAGTIDGFTKPSSGNRQLGQPMVTGGNPFAGVTLIDGTYSDTLGKYVVYGNEGDSKVAFVSEDGRAWKKSVIFEKGTFNTNTKKGIVWWDAQKEFVIGDLNNAWVSEDGIAWNFIEGIGLNKNASDMVVVNNNLYASNGVMSVYKYTDLTEESKTELSARDTSETEYYFYHMALSNDENPAILLADGRGGNGFAGAVKAAGSDIWLPIATVGNWAAPEDAVYSKALKKFVVVLDKNWRVSIVDTDGSNGVNGPAPTDPSPENKIFFSSVETNDSTMLFGSKNGNLYTVPDTASMSSTTVAQPVSVANGLSENTKPVTNLFLGKAGEFCAIASDGVDSDILFVDKDAKNYWKASEVAALDSLKAGESIAVRVQSINETDETSAFTMISAIYDGGKLLQIATEEMEIAARTNTYLTQEITLNEDIPETATMKVYMWDSLSGMQPVSESTGFFG